LCILFAIAKFLFLLRRPYCKTEGSLHSHSIMCYSEQYVRLKRSVFSPRRKVDVNCVLFIQSASSSTLSVQHAVENARSAVGSRTQHTQSIYDTVGSGWGIVFRKQNVIVVGRLLTYFMYQANLAASTSERFSQLHVARWSSGYIIPILSMIYHFCMN